MIDPKIAIDENPTPALHGEISRLLQEYNWTKVERPVVEPFAVFLRHPESDAIIGGLYGASFGGWSHIETLFVPEDLRKRGVGSSLVKKAEETATKRQCVGIWLDTFTFQAPGFYEKMGYRVMGKLADFPKGHERIYYLKRLDK